MAQRAPSASAAKAAANPRDFTGYADKKPTDLQERFAQWILDNTGYEPDDPDSYFDGVRLAVSLRMAFQASPENQAVLAENKAKAQAKAEKPAKPVKAKAKKAAEPEPEPELEDEEDTDDEPEEDEAEEPAPVKRKPGKRVKRDDDAEEEVPF